MRHITGGRSLRHAGAHLGCSRLRLAGRVVRFAGEAPLLALVRPWRGGESIACVAGLSTRAGDGPPADVLTRFPTTLLLPHEGMRMLGRKVPCVCHAGLRRPVAATAAPRPARRRGRGRSARRSFAGSSCLSIGRGRNSSAHGDDVADELAGLARSGHGYASRRRARLPTGKQTPWLAFRSATPVKAAKVPSLLWDACCVLNG